jgi:AraC-like DNA-binding protein
MPAALRAAVVAMFVQPDAADTPHRLAARAGITRRSLDRWVARSGLASARLLVAAPKLLVAYGQLRRPDVSVASVAARVGYGSPRSLERQCEALLGVRPAALRDQLTPEAFAQALARGLMGGVRLAPEPGEEDEDDAELDAELDAQLDAELDAALRAAADRPRGPASDGGAHVQPLRHAGP